MSISILSYADAGSSNITPLPIPFGMPGFCLWIGEGNRKVKEFIVNRSGLWNNSWKIKITLYLNNTLISRQFINVAHFFITIEN